jgi:hypothetical protein
MSRICSFFDLKREDQQLFLIALLLLGLTRLGLKLLTFSQARYLSEKITRKTNITPSNPTQIKQVVDAVNRASRYQPRVKCLARALTTQILLSWWGQSSQLCIGVAKDELGKFEAHAWVEQEGKIVINDLADLSRYTKLPSWQNLT